MSSCCQQRSAESDMIVNYTMQRGRNRGHLLIYAACMKKRHEGSGDQYVLDTRCTSTATAICGSGRRIPQALAICVSAHPCLTFGFVLGRTARPSIYGPDT